MLFDRRLSARLLSGAVGLLLIAQPVAAQTGIDFLRGGVCNGRTATLIAAALAATTIYFAAFALYRWGTGIQMIGSSDPNEQTEGKTRIKGGFYSFGAAILILSAERILAFIGISIPSCINLGISL